MSDDEDNLKDIDKVNDNDDSFDFRKEVQEADWLMLKPHHERMALFILKPGYDLVQVGEQMARDDVDAIKALLNKGDLYRPSENDANGWAQVPEKKVAKFLIVSPYVIIQLIGEYH
jgi:hypothetical protein